MLGRHISLEDKVDDQVLSALSDATRRDLLARLRGRGGQSLAQLCQGLDINRTSVAKHLKALEMAGLVTTQWLGREKLHYIELAPIRRVAERLLVKFG